MTIDLMQVAEIVKDKVGRKEIIALATMGCLTALIWHGVTDWKPLSFVLVSGIAGMAIQALLDLKRPRTNGNGAAKAPNGA